MPKSYRETDLSIESMNMKETNKCPVCGKSNLEYMQTCPVCNWQNDIAQRDNPDWEGCANNMSLNQAIEAYKNNKPIS